MFEGQAPFESLLFPYTTLFRSIDISANGGRVRFFRNIASVTMDLNGVERIDVHALGGADNSVNNEPTVTDIAPIAALVDLAGTLGGAVGDGLIDTVTANGSAGD